MSDPIYRFIMYRFIMYTFIMYRFIMYTFIMYSRCARPSRAVMIPQRGHLKVALARSRAKLTNRNILYRKNESACLHGQVALVL
jgi:hypothetical protein